MRLFFHKSTLQGLLLSKIILLSFLLHKFLCQKEFLCISL